MKSKGIEFREDVKPSDAQAIRDITESTGFFSEHEIDVAVELLDERLAKGTRSGYFFLFAGKAGRPIGYACFGPIACTLASYDLYWIAVHSDFRGQGIGSILLAESERIIRNMGGERIYIETSSREQYGPTRGFYLHCAYEEDAILEDFYGPGDSKVIYRKVLEGSGDARKNSKT
jgi:ribosomal protein S18 acetylase RimI-like enzyme